MRLVSMAAIAAISIASSLALATSRVAASIDPLPECAEAESQGDKNICASGVLKRADADLNAVYKELLKKLQPDEIKRVRAAQLAWIAFRDAECFVETGGGPEGGGTIWPLLHDECLVDLTRKRIRDLREQVKCPGGHLEC